MTRTTWPEAADEAGWAAAVSAEQLGECPPGILVGALRALFLRDDRRLVQTMTLHVSDRVTRRLRKLISTQHANGGEDIIAEAHGVLMGAIFEPASTDGPEMVDNFWPRVRNRGIDAARVEGRHARRHLPLRTDEDGELVLPRGHRIDGGAGSVEVSHLLSRIEDPRKRLAFRLFMDGMRVRKGDVCIASVLGCDSKTAAKWIAQAREILAAEIEIGA